MILPKLASDFIWSLTFFQSQVKLQSMSKNSIIFLVVLILLLGGGYFAYKKYKASQTVTPTPSVETTTPSEQPSSPSATPAASASATVNNPTVSITSTAFTPSSATVNVGGTVTWNNQDSTNHTVNSDLHPTHLIYPPLNLGVITPGNSKSLTFPTPGTFKYHDHLHPSLVGQIIVR